MWYSDKVKVVPRFQRAIRIDTDFGTTEALDGYICTASSKQSIHTICEHLERTSQAAFTWTGPYGCGKSSLAVAFGAVLAGNINRRKSNAKYLTEALAEKVWDCLEPQENGWHILPIVGRRERPHIVIAETLEKLSLFNFKPKIKDITEQEVIKALTSVSEKRDDFGGILLILDEMGSFLEYSAIHGGEGVQFFQNLAEIASRSNKKIVLIGVLHQSFTAYADKLTKSVRTDWSKVQGRFVDVPINVAGEEQIELIAQAIENDQNKTSKTDHQKLCKQTVAELIKRKPSVSTSTENSLYEAWPLHPMVTCLLGPISKRSFGQNQRSIFAFMLSAEEYGFQYFLKNNEIASNVFLSPSYLWEYLQVNYESVISASPDSHKWMIARDGIDRAENQGASEIHFDIIKAIALINIFSSGSGIAASLNMLVVSFPSVSKEEMKEILLELEEWSIIIFRKHKEEYTLFAGSDFDFEPSFEQAKLSKPEHNLSSMLHNTVELKPVLAKRFYHEMGSQQWFELKLIAQENLQEALASKLSLGTVGRFLYVVDKISVSNICGASKTKTSSQLNVIGMTSEESQLHAYSEELCILEHMWEKFPELSSDSIARMELEGRIDLCKTMIRDELQKEFAQSRWWFKGEQRDDIQSLYDLSICASDLVSNLYTDAPIIKNELVCKDKPSPPAVAARKNLLKKMALNLGHEKLGIDKYPAEWGIFQSVLVATGLYCKVNEEWKFIRPNKNHNAQLYNAWMAVIEELKQLKTGRVQVSKIYTLLSNSPFGVKNGLHPLLIVAMIIAEEKNIAFYREGEFRPSFTDLDIDYLLADPSSIELRWMDLNQSSKEFLSEMIVLIEQLGSKVTIDETDPLGVSRLLIKIFDNFHPWTNKTQKLSINARKIRPIFKKANDPNKFLFDDLPNTFGSKVTLEEKISKIRESIVELQNHYPTAMNRIQSIIFEQLQIYGTSTESINEIKERAFNIANQSGDTEMEAFIIRLKEFNSGGNTIDEIASLCSKKPTILWVDNDYEKTLLKVTDLCQKFVKMESYKYVEDREPHQSSISVLVGLEGKIEVNESTYLISKKDKKKIKEIKEDILALLLEESGIETKVLLSALGETAVKIMKKEND